MLTCVNMYQSFSSTLHADTDSLDIWCDWFNVTSGSLLTEVDHFHPAILMNSPLWVSIFVSRQLSLSQVFYVCALWPSCLFYTCYHQFIFNTHVHGSNTCVNSSWPYFGHEEMPLLEILLDLFFGITLHLPLCLVSCGLFFNLFCLDRRCIINMSQLYLHHRIEPKEV